MRSIVEGRVRSGKKFDAMFTTKMKDKLLSYEAVFKVIQLRYPGCPLLSDCRMWVDSWVI